MATPCIHQTSSVRKFFLVALLIFPGLVFAQAKSYFYEAINFDIRVHPNSTFDVTERQTFDYRGSFHAATRDIPLRLVGSITDVKVLDGTTNQPLRFSAKRLDKLDPDNWGKYTRYRSGGAEHIEWYYNLADTVYEWIIKYKVHGGLAFYRDHDELYWNLFTDYQVPIGEVSVRVFLPVNQFLTTDLKAAVYASSVEATQTVLDNQTFLFTVSNLGPREKLTIAAGWPKGLVSEQSFWLDWVKINWAYLLSLIITLGSFLYGLGFWLKHEKFNQGRGTIIAQYEPPQKLKPAMAEVIIKEKISDKAWSATIIDLAVRGHLKIKEEKVGWFGFGRHDYRIEKLFQEPVDLEDYEKKFLELIFADKDYFSTKELRRAGNTKKQDFSRRLIALKTKLYKETEKDTGAYAVGPSREGKKRATWSILFLFLLPFSAGFLVSLGRPGSQYAFLILTIIIAGLALRAFIKYEARLSKEGQILKEEWLGFKLYLATAEKYRLQNLTSDLFEKFLPYAIIFGVEKKWGEAFRSINVPPPAWYGSHGHFGSSGGPSVAGAGNFSASMFSASFSSSFTSAFASSGGGASGGGGGAGGGGGGGGGGAS